jgi:N-acyl-D-amino-acid deacylase
MRKPSNLASLLAGAAALLALAAQPARASTLIVNARIVDGTGAAAKAGSVRIDGDRIAAVGALKPMKGETVVDAHGQVLAPGFIDTHSHHDRELFDHPDDAVAVSQGVTTIVVGQDGFSNSPLKDWFARLKASPVAVNVASYSGHNTVRGEVMGKDFRREATPAEVKAMADLVRADMAAGALGLSSGLEYDPGIYSAKSEVVALAKAAAESQGRYISHMRSEDAHEWEAIDEIIAIGRATGQPVQISHMKLAMVDWWGQAARFTAKLDAARAEGVKITGDVYPYEFWQSGPTVLFPKRDFKDRAAAQFALDSLAPADGIRLSAFPHDPSLVGKTVAEISASRGTDPAQTLMDLIAEDGPDEGASIIATSMDAKDTAALVAWPNSNICSDGGIEDLHPRGAGTFTKVLRLYVREQHLLTLEQAVHKMTGLAAEHMGFTNRGVIRPGAHADLVLFDPATVADRSVIGHADALSVGIAEVWVEGQPVWLDGKVTGARPGRAIRRGDS